MTDEQWKSLIASYGCYVCRKMGFLTPPSLHHIREGMGMGQRNTDRYVIPLCKRHHQDTPDSFHGNRRAFTSKWGNEYDIILDMLEDIQGGALNERKLPPTVREFG